MIDIITTGTWLSATLEDIGLIANETILDYVEDGDRIINIQLIKLDSGLSQFWIYVEKGDAK